MTPPRNGAIINVMASYVPKQGWAAYMRQRRAKAVAAGLCGRCATRRPQKGMWQCEHCRSTKLEVDRAWRAAVAERGMTTRAAKERSAGRRP